MAFVDKVDKIEKMEQRMWKAAGIKAKEKKKLLRDILNPKNYKWGILGMVGYSLGKVVESLFIFCGQMIDGFIHEAHRTIDDPIFDDVRGNIFHLDNE